MKISFTKPGRFSVSSKRVFDIDIEHCPHCGVNMKIIAAILVSSVLAKILGHLLSMPE